VSVQGNAQRTTSKLTRKKAVHEGHSTERGLIWFDVGG
jgi:hypothetical protein